MNLQKNAAASFPRQPDRVELVLGAVRQLVVVDGDLGAGGALLEGAAEGHGADVGDAVVVDEALVEALVHLFGVCGVVGVSGQFL